MSDDDYNEISQYKWYVTQGGYAWRDWNENGKKKSIGMHRQIMKPPKDLVVDHINGDKLDNRKENLRVCTQRENSLNKIIGKDNTSGYKGVSYAKRDNKWQVHIKKDGKSYYCGAFDGVEEAARAYDYYADKHYGEFARLNFPSEVPMEPRRPIVKRNNKSGYRGVTWDGRRNSWRATIVRNYKQKYLGNFESVIDAAEAYNKAAIELFGEKAKLNLIKKEMSV